MLLRIGRGLVILALSLSIGAHWAALQSVAWVGMLVEYSQHASVAMAIAQTFDGSHPCSLCKQVVAHQSSPPTDAPLLTKTKPDLICSIRMIVLVPPCQDFEFTTFERAAAARSDSPPTPPPRFELS